MTPISTLAWKNFAYIINNFDYLDELGYICVTNLQPDGVGGIILTFTINSRTNKLCLYADGRMLSFYYLNDRLVNTTIITYNDLGFKFNVIENKS